MWTKGAAPTNSTHREEATPRRTVFLYRLKGVLRTRWIEATWRHTPRRQITVTPDRAVRTRVAVEELEGTGSAHRLVEVVLKFIVR